MEEDEGKFVLSIDGATAPSHPGPTLTDVNYRVTQFTQATKVNLQGQQLTRIRFREWLSVENSLSSWRLSFASHESTPSGD